jgi:hypothetical protein
MEWALLSFFLSKVYKSFDRLEKEKKKRDRPARFEWLTPSLFIVKCMRCTEVPAL